MKWQVRYDSEADILYIASEGMEAEAVEIADGVFAELDANGELIGVEILRASQLLRDVIESLWVKAMHSQVK